MRATQILIKEALNEKLFHFIKEKYTGFENGDMKVLAVLDLKGELLFVLKNTSPKDELRPIMNEIHGLLKDVDGHYGIFPKFIMDFQLEKKKPKRKK
jgi:hypothetical protein